MWKERSFQSVRREQHVMENLLCWVLRCYWLITEKWQRVGLHCTYLSALLLQIFFRGVVFFLALGKELACLRQSKYSLSFSWFLCLILLSCYQRHFTYQIIIFFLGWFYDLCWKCLDWEIRSKEVCSWKPTASFKFLRSGNIGFFLLFHLSCSCLDPGSLGFGVFSMYCWPELQEHNCDHIVRDNE